MTELNDHLKLLYQRAPQSCTARAAANRCAATRRPAFKNPCRSLAREHGDPPC